MDASHNPLKNIDGSNKTFLCSTHNQMSPNTAVTHLDILHGILRFGLPISDDCIAELGLDPSHTRSIEASLDALLNNYPEELQGQARETVLEAVHESLPAFNCHDKSWRPPFELGIAPAALHHAAHQELDVNVKHNAEQEQFIQLFDVQHQLYREPPVAFAQNTLLNTNLPVKWTEEQQQIIQQQAAQQQMHQEYEDADEQKLFHNFVNPEDQFSYESEDNTIDDDDNEHAFQFQVNHNPGASRAEFGHSVAQAYLPNVPFLDSGAMTHADVANLLKAKFPLWSRRFTQDFMTKVYRGRILQKYVGPLVAPAKRTRASCG